MPILQWFSHLISTSIQRRESREDCEQLNWMVWDAWGRSWRRECDDQGGTSKNITHLEAWGSTITLPISWIQHYPLPWVLLMVSFYLLYLWFLPMSLY